MTGYTRGEILKLDSKNRILESKTHAFPDEFWDGTEYSDLPCKYTWNYKDIQLSDEEGGEFSVWGSIVDEEINTELKFKKGFRSLSSAKSYYFIIQKKYPKSSIVMSKKTFQNLRYYS